MESLFVFLATSLALRLSPATFRRYLIGSTGCSTLLLRGANTLHIKYTPEGDKIYFSEGEASGVSYGLICISMKDLYTMQEAQDILTEYLNKLRKPFSIAHTLPMELERTAGQVVVTRYWQDREGLDWKARGYTNGKIVALLYVKNIGDVPVRDQDAFLNAFRFSSIG